MTPGPFPKCSDRLWGPTSPLFYGYLGNSPLLKATKSCSWPFSSNAEAKNVWRCACSSPYVFVSWCSSKRRDNLHVKTISWLNFNRWHWIFHMSSEPNLFLEGGFDVTCLLLNQKESHIVTVIICLKYNETDQRELLLTWFSFFGGGEGRCKNFEHGIGLSRAKAENRISINTEL